MHLEVTCHSPNWNYSGNFHNPLSLVPLHSWTNPLTLPHCVRIGPYHCTANVCSCKRLSCLWPVNDMWHDVKPELPRLFYCIWLNFWKYLQPWQIRNAKNLQNIVSQLSWLFFVGFNNSLVRLYLLLEILCPYFYHSVHDIIPHFIICGGPKMSYAKNSLFNPVD